MCIHHLLLPYTWQTRLCQLVWCIYTCMEMFRAQNHMCMSRACYWQLPYSQISESNIGGEGSGWQRGDLIVLKPPVVHSGIGRCVLFAQTNAQCFTITCKYRTNQPKSDVSSWGGALTTLWGQHWQWRRWRAASWSGCFAATWSTFRL
jgi:hypothetical protein